MSHKAEVKWTSEMAFEVEVNNHKFMVDADENVGGQNLGPRPKALTLAALGGCTGMDVISILKKMHVEPKYFNVSVEAELTDEHPKYYNKIHLTYSFKGDGLPLDKLDKAITLSQERYCGVTAMLSKAAEITYEIKIL
jgi:putative redox protein